MCLVLSVGKLRVPSQRSFGWSWHWVDIYHGISKHPKPPELFKSSWFGERWRRHTLHDRDHWCWQNHDSILMWYQTALQVLKKCGHRVVLLRCSSAATCHLSYLSCHIASNGNIYLTDDISCWISRRMSPLSIRGASSWCIAHWKGCHLYWLGLQPEILPLAKRQNQEIRHLSNHFPEKNPVVFFSLLNTRA